MKLTPNPLLRVNWIYKTSKSIPKKAQISISSLDDYQEDNFEQKIDIKRYFHLFMKVIKHLEQAYESEKIKIESLQRLRKMRLDSIFSL
jgi:hypothetical protein